MEKSKSVVVKLDYPIEWAAIEGEGMTLVTEIELKRPKTKHIDGIGSNPTLATLIKIATKVSAYSPRFFGELDASDGLKIGDAIGDFLDGGQETGKIK